MRTTLDMARQKVISRKGQGMTEYALIIGFVALLLVSVLSLLHDPITRILAAANEALGIGP